MITPVGISFQDDVIAEGVARRVVVDSRNAKTEVEHTTLGQERVRIARELHDGVLQSLAAMALQLHALSRLLDDVPEPAHRRLRDVELALQQEQQTLREWIDTLKATPSAKSSRADLGTLLRELCDHVTGSGLPVALAVSDAAIVPRGLGDEIKRLVQEALSNTVRHARARCAAVDVRVREIDVMVEVSDNGWGFPFRGRYDLAALNARNLGPASIKERIAALEGDLVVTSSLAGARLEMRLPLAAPAHGLRQTSHHAN